MGDYRWDFETEATPEAVRAELALVNALMTENRVLARELARVQQRCTEWQAENQAERTLLQQELARARASVVASEFVIAQLRESRDAATRPRYLRKGSRSISPAKAAPFPARPGLKRRRIQRVKPLRA